MGYEMQKTAYVLDFDGTVTTVDLSTLLAMKFGGQEFEETENAYFQKQLGMKEWLAKACSVLPPDLHDLVSLSLEREYCGGICRILETYSLPVMPGLYRQ